MVSAMKLYFSPLACSLAARIALYEAGASVDFVHVDPSSKRTPDGVDYASIHALGQVPLLECEHGLLSENAAILQYIALRYPLAELAPTDAWGQSELRQWLSFIGTELHKAVFTPLLERSAPGDAKRFALSKADARLSCVALRLAKRRFLLERFSVADAYLFAVLNWAAVTPIELKAWPELERFRHALLERPQVARAFAEERALYRTEPR
ncbi:MAG: glutathione binding-like protein [Polyangiaceae bacterium]